jgi:hypothetical protein
MLRTRELLVERGSRLFGCSGGTERHRRAWLRFSPAPSPCGGSCSRRRVHLQRAPSSGRRRVIRGIVGVSTSRRCRSISVTRRSTMGRLSCAPAHPAHGAELVHHRLVLGLDQVAQLEELAGDRRLLAWPRITTAAAAAADRPGQLEPGSRGGGWPRSISGNRSAGSGRQPLRRRAAPASPALVRRQRSS